MGTAAKRNSGLELLVKAIRRAASSLVQRFCSHRAFAAMAPIGKPEVKPKAKTKAQLPDIWNIGRMIGLSKRPKICIKLVWSKILDRMINGSNDGTKVSAHSLSPRIAPLKVADGENTNKSENTQRNIK